MKLGDFSQITKFEILKSNIIEKIKNGELKPGNKLPSINSMMQSNNISFTTINRALIELEKEGYITRIRGGGIYIKETASGNSEQIELVLPLSPMHDSIYDLLLIRLMKGVESTLNRNNYKTLVSISNPQSDQEFLKDFNPKIKGYIIFLKDTFGDFEKKQVLQLKEKNIPFVLIDRYIEEIETPKVIVDHIKGTFLATQHLIEQKCESTAFVYLKDCSNLSSVKDKITGYKNAVQKFRIEKSQLLSLDEFIIKIDSFIKTVGKKGIVCHDDIIANTVINELNLRKVKIPDEVSIVGYGAILTSSYLSTIEQFPEKMGKKASELLINLIAHKKVKDLTIKIVPKLQIKNSSMLLQNKR